MSYLTPIPAGNGVAPSIGMIASEVFTQKLQSNEQTISNNVATSLLSLSIPVGVWNISGFVSLRIGDSSYIRLTGLSIGTAVSITNDNKIATFDGTDIYYTQTTAVGFFVPIVVASISGSSTTYNLVVQAASGSASPLKGCGWLRATRVA